MAYKYKIWVRRSDTHDYIGNEDILVGNAGNEHSKFTSGLTIDKAFSYVEFDSWEDLVESITGSGCTPELTWDEPAEIKYDYKTQPQGSIPQSGGTWILSASTTCDLKIIAFTLDTGSGFVTLSQNLANGTCSMRVNENTNKDSGRTITVTVHTADTTIKHTWKWEQSKADWEISDADYLQFTYGWTEDNGLDLDTFTFVKFAGDSEVYGDCILSKRGVGFMANNKILTASTTYNDAVLSWAGDNQGTGGEYTLINFQKFHDEFKRDADVYIMGSWYRVMKDGVCNIILSGYRGGTISEQSSYATGFTIIDGVKIQDDASVQNICYAKGRGNSSDYFNYYGLLCVMHYDYSENKVYLYTSGPEFEDSEYYRIGIYKAWVGRVEIVDDVSGTKIIDVDGTQQDASKTIEYEFTGSTNIILDVGISDVLYRNNTTEIQHIQNYSIGVSKGSSWPEGDDNYTIITETTTEKAFHIEIDFSNDGIFDKENGKYREYNIIITPLSTSVLGSLDAMYIDLIQYKQEDETTTTLGLRAISYEGFGDSGVDFIETTEGGKFLVVGETASGKELSNVKMTSNNIKYYVSNPPLYIGDGYYAVVVNKKDIYNGYGTSGLGEVTIEFSADNLQENSSITNSISRQDHNDVPRYLNGFGNVDFAPRSGVTMTKQIYGMAITAQEIDGNEVKSLDESRNLVVDYDYKIDNIVDYPKNYTGTMFNSSLNIDWKMSTLTVQVTPNTEVKPRVGYVKTCYGNNYGVLKSIFLQDGEYIRFGFFQNYMHEPSPTTGVSSCLMVVDLSQHGKTYEYSYSGKEQRFRKIQFFAGISSSIRVKDGDGNIINPTTTTEANMLFDVYLNPQTTTEYKFIIEVL